MNGSRSETVFHSFVRRGDSGGDRKEIEDEEVVSETLV